MSMRWSGFIRHYCTSQSKTALITGGSKGIGLSIAHKLSSEGFNCILLARDEAKLKSSVAALPTNNSKLTHAYIKFDLSRGFEDLDWVIDQFYNKKQDKSIDVLVNCAGTTQNTMLPLTSVDKIQSIVNTNLVSAMVLSKLVSRQLLRAKKPGHIINISSVLALDKYNAIKGTSVYSATKLALIGFTKKLAEELGGKNVHCNVVLPSLIRNTTIGQSVNLEEFRDIGIDYIDKDDVSDVVSKIIKENLNGQVIVVP